MVNGLMEGVVVSIGRSNDQSDELNGEKRDENNDESGEESGEKYVAKARIKQPSSLPDGSRFFSTSIIAHRSVVSTSRSVRFP